MLMNSLKKPDCNAKIRHIEDKTDDYSKYVTTSHYIKFTSDIIDKNRKIWIQQQIRS